MFDFWGDLRRHMRYLWTWTCEVQEWTSPIHTFLGLQTAEGLTIAATIEDGDRPEEKPRPPMCGDDNLTRSLAY